MSDTPTGPADGGRNASQFNNIGSIQGNINIKLPEIDSAARSVGMLVGQLQGLKSILSNFSSTTGASLNNMLLQIQRNATAAATALSSVGSGGGGGAPSGGGTPPIGGSAGGWAAQASQQAQASISSRMPGGIAAAGSYLKGTDSLTGGIVMGGLRFLRDRIGTNRELSIQTGGELSQVARQQFGMGANGTGAGGVERIMKQLSQFPGSVLGTPRDLLDLFTMAPQLGASFGFGGDAQGSYQGRPAGQGPRARGFLQGVREAQMLAPGQSVGQIAGTIGGFAADTGAQQQSAFLTGGAYSMIAAGGRQKSLAEWAESVMKWLMDLRGSPNKGKPFTYGELMAQYFPGSNIDAWFQANGVPQNMRTYWWTYALEKAQRGGGEPLKITPDQTNVAYQRLAATSESTRTEFNLGGQMMGAYVNKEQANKWFNSLFGQMQTNLIPAFANSIGKFVQYLPDTLEDLLMSGIEGIAAGDVKGDTAWSGSGDIGDDSGGMYGALGGTGMAGLSQNMRSKLGPMMRANPRLRVNSGLRDNAMQKRLKDQGHTRVSGKPSAHTRGDAADLGPRSQYGWIIKNASKFGLKSGANQGEPWHVGVGDVGDDAWDMFSKFSTMLDSGASGVTDVLKWLFDRLFGMIPGVGNTQAPDTTDPSTKTGADFYNNLVNASKGLKIGGPLTGLPSSPLEGGGGGNNNVSFSDNPVAGYIPGYNNTDGAKRSSSGGSSWSDFFRDVLKGLPVATTQANMTKLAAVVQGEGGGGAFNPFNSIGGDYPNKFNKNPGVENYPDWNTGVQYSISLLRQQNTAGMLRNLQGEGSYKDWLNAVSGFYQSWGGKFPSGISESTASAQLSKPAWGVGDEMSYQMSMPQTQTKDKPSMVFHNTFQIVTGQSGGGGIDVRRTTTRIADLLEDEMDKRLARNN